MENQLLYEKQYLKVIQNIIHKRRPQKPLIIKKIQTNMSFHCTTVLLKHKRVTRPNLEETVNQLDFSQLKECMIVWVTISKYILILYICPRQICLPSPKLADNYIHPEIWKTSEAQEQFDGKKRIDFSQQRKKKIYGSM